MRWNILYIFYIMPGDNINLYWFPIWMWVHYDLFVLLDVFGQKLYVFRFENIVWHRPIMINRRKGKMFYVWFIF